MGSGSSVGKAYFSEDDLDKDIKETPRTLSYSAKAVVTMLSYKRPEMGAPAVSRTTQVACESSWYGIVAAVGLNVFGNYFFRIFEERDPEAFALFTPSKRGPFSSPSRFENSESLLFNLVTYLLTLNDTTFNTKKKLRAVGRRHFISGIHRNHVQSFNDSFLKAVEFVPGTKGNTDALKSWVTLLDFTVQEMYVEDLKLLKH
jgi:hemoglobin-like flavoprotein